MNDLGPIADGEGATTTYSCQLEAAWCSEFFMLSKDMNHRLHGPGGAGIVQGAAIFTTIGTCVSKYAPGYMIAGVSKMSFRGVARIGDVVTISLTLLGERLGAKKVALKVCSADGTPLLDDLELMLFPAK